MVLLSQRCELKITTANTVISDLNACAFWFPKFLANTLVQASGLSIEPQRFEHEIGPYLYPMYGPSLYEGLLALMSNHSPTMPPWLNARYLQEEHQRYLMELLYSPWSSELKDSLQQMLPEVPGATRLFKELKLRGARFGICTAWNWAVAKIALRAHDIDVLDEWTTTVEFFPSHLGQRLDKDRDGPWNVAAARMRSNAQSITCLEDSPLSAGGAILAGYGRVIVAPSKSDLDQYEFLLPLAKTKGCQLIFVKDWTAISVI